MSKVTVFVSEDSEPSQKVTDLLDEYNISYELNNVTKEKDYLKELQMIGIYGTPATKVDGEFILGYQKNKLKHALGLDDVSHYSSLYDGFKS